MKKFDKGAIMVCSLMVMVLVGSILKSKLVLYSVLVFCIVGFIVSVVRDINKHRKLKQN